MADMMRKAASATAATATASATAAANGRRPKHERESGKKESEN